MSEPHAESAHSSGEGDAGGMQPVQPSAALQRVLASATPESTTSAASAVVHNTVQRGAGGGKVWYAPWTWFRRGSAQQSTSTAHKQPSTTHQTNTTEDNTQGPTRPTHKRLLPEVRMAPLEADQVAQLTAHVKADRQRILDDEEEIHKVLTNIERARYRYTVPLAKLPCEEAVQGVTQCYEECNARHGITSETNTLPETSRGIVMSDEAHMAYTRDLLGCADVVQALRACVDERLRAYSEADTTKS